MTSFRCRHGWHSWAFREISDARYLTGLGAPVLRDLTDQCRRCGLRRTRTLTKLPRRVRS